MRYAEVAVHTAAPYRQAFTYAVPDGVTVVPGQEVLVPFGSRTLQGIVLTVTGEPRFGGAVRPITAATDPAELPPLLPHQIAIAQWLSRYYLAPLAACVALMLPPGVARAEQVRWHVTPEAAGATEAEQSLLDALRDPPPAERGGKRAAPQPAALHHAAGALQRRGLLRREYGLGPRGVGHHFERHLRLTEAGASYAGTPIMDQLRAAGGSLPLTALRQDASWSAALLRRLLKEGVVEELQQRRLRDPLEGRAPPPYPATSLTLEQARALRQLFPAEPAYTPTPRVSLLHGVTGSGKTEVYLAAMAHVLQRGQRAILLVPEIALTPQTIERVAGRFPGRVAILHSGLTPGQRFDQWCAVQDGRYDIVVGSRSALFAPVAALGLIVLDEEHEWTYKQQDAPPRYHAREVAQKLVELTGATLLLGSATPDVVSYQRAEAGHYQILSLPRRVRPTTSTADAGERLPPVEVVDLARELREGNRGIFSRALVAALGETLARGEQALLFLNRRGSASFLLCRNCGHVPRCRRCSISLTCHGDEQRLICHQCGRGRRLPLHCPRCRSPRIRAMGLGTEAVVDEVQRRFPEARVLRWDRDAARHAGDHAALYARLQRGEADVLVGTQMVAKGLDLPRVTLVGIVNADLSLNRPDYLSGERAFQVLTQVAGRAGRREREGLVILQTYSPQHYAVLAAARHDYAAFYRREIDFRRRGAYPPFTHLTRLVFAHSNQKYAETEARRAAQDLRRRIETQSLTRCEVLGPVPCQVARLRGRWRWQILLRASQPLELLDGLELPAGWNIDRDPRAFS